MQFVIKKMKPVLTVGIIVTFKPSAVINDSFCVSSPKPKPTSKLNDGPAKQAAILVIHKRTCDVRLSKSKTMNES